LVDPSLAHDELVGTVLGKDYRVEEPIGVGGMAVVYKVEHLTLHKQFAAKVLSRDLAANLEARARFTQEAHAASQLDHENIVNISDFGVTSDQRPYFVMELLRGQTLDQRLAEGPLTIEQVIAISVPVGRALAYAHNEGIVHRDVKPENIFLVQRSQGRFGIKVVDFGIAKTPANQRLTQMGQTLGSPLYMSPEACRGEEVDHRADLYSFGILLYLMLCGRLPFTDPSLLKVLQLQVKEPLPPPCTINPGLDPALGAVLERALAKSPDDRYLSMEALLRDLEAAIPPGSDGLLIDVTAGITSAFRATPFPTSSQRLPTFHVTGELPVTAPEVVAVSPPPRKRSRLVLFGLLAVALASVAVVFAITRSDPPDPRAELPAPAPAPSPPAPTPPAPEPTKIQLTIDTEPAGATVTLDGVPLPPTPARHSIERATRTATLAIRKPGYEPEEHEIDLRSDVRESYKLVRVKPPTTVATTKRPPKPPAPPKPPPRPAAGSGSAKPPTPPLDIKLSR
jgi:eukaryotic-like serine/threonine-protein kinase